MFEWDDDVSYEPYSATFDRNRVVPPDRYGRTRDLYDANPFYDYEYSRDGNFDVALNKVLHSFGETYNSEGVLTGRKIRGKRGQYGTNIFSKGEYVDIVAHAMQDIIRQSLEQNYDRLVGRGLTNEGTGTLRRAAVEGTFERDEDMLEGFKFVYRIANLRRDRRRSFSGWKTQAQESSNYTWNYGPVIFRGRSAIMSIGKMTFPAYGGMVQTGSAIRTHFVKGTPPANIFELDNAQVSAMKMTIMQPLKNIIFQTLIKSNNGGYN